MDLEENLILYDWLSFTAPSWSDPYLFVKLLGLENCSWETIKGARGYQDRLYFNSISIHYNGRPDMGIWCEMSGQGCRTFETLSTLPNKWEDLFPLLFEYHLNITRLDVAYDDHVGILDIDQIALDTWHQEYVSKSDYWEVVTSAKGQTVQIGSPKSDVLIRIYDKARERHCPAGEHWVRCELQLRRDRAVRFLELKLPIGDAFRGVVMNYLRFVDPLPGDSNRWRWPMKYYWQNFLDDAHKISIYRAPGIDYNLDRLQKYVINQAGNAIAAYVDIKGEEQFMKDLAARDTKPNLKYDQLVAKYKSLS